MNHIKEEQWKNICLEAETLSGRLELVTRAMSAICDSIKADDAVFEDGGFGNKNEMGLYMHEMLIGHLAGLSLVEGALWRCVDVASALSERMHGNSSDAAEVVK